MQKIAISGLNTTDNPAPGISVAKSLKDEFDIIGLSYDPNEPGNYLDVISKSYLMPYPSLGIEVLLTRLKALKEKEDILMIIPCLDSELPLYIKYQERIQALGILLFLPTEKNFKNRTKSKLVQLTKQLPCSYPKTYEANSMLCIKNLEKDLTYPHMVKGDYYQAYKTYNKESSLEYASKISLSWGFPILLQEFIEGDELNLIGMGDGKGNLLGAMSIKKLTTTAQGKVWTAISIKHEGLVKLAEDFTTHTSWRGPFELECIVKNSELFLLEINPRFPSWVYFATALGINFPKQLIQLAKKETVSKNFNYQTAKMYVRFTDELITDFHDFSTLMTKKEL